MSSLLFSGKIGSWISKFFLKSSLPHKIKWLLFKYHRIFSFFFWISYTDKFKMNDDILQKQVLSRTIEFRVSDTVQEFKMFNKSLFLHLPCVINHMAALWEFISVSITNTHSKSLINDCCLLNLTVSQLQQAAQEWATYRPLCGLVF